MLSIGCSNASVGFFNLSEGGIAIPPLEGTSAGNKTAVSDRGYNCRS
jgi:hypothetical protein